jgi:hypothetical protein
MYGTIWIGAQHWHDGNSITNYQIVHSGSWGLKPMLKAALVGAAAFAILTSVNFLPKAH